MQADDNLCVDVVIGFIISISWTWDIDLLFPVDLTKAEFEAEFVVM